MIPFETIIALDSGIIGKITNRKMVGEPVRIRRWLGEVLTAGYTVMLPEIADYECRRKLLHIGSATGIRSLDWLKLHCAFLPIDSEIMLDAAQVWADHRTIGRVRGSEDRLDGDAILMASLRSLGADNLILATTNVKDFQGIFDVRHWHEIEV